MENKRSIFFILGVMVFIMLLGILNPTKAYAATSIKNANVTLKSTSYTYDGTAKRPGVTVVLNKKTLVYKTDYLVAYFNNINAGTATIQIRGTNKYKDEIKKTFKINQREIKNTNITLNPTSYTYDGSAKKPTVTVKLNGKTVASSNYTIKYSNNKNVGNGIVTITGKGNLKGTTTRSFKIVQKDIRLAAIELKTYQVASKDVKPSVKSVNISNIGYLTSGKDYTVSYDTSNAKNGIGYVIITGKGNYKNSTKKQYVIKNSNNTTNTTKNTTTKSTTTTTTPTTTTTTTTTSTTTKKTNTTANNTTTNNTTANNTTANNTTTNNTTANNTTNSSTSTTNSTTQTIADTTTVIKDLVSSGKIDESTASNINNIISKAENINDVQEVQSKLEDLTKDGKLNTEDLNKIVDTINNATNNTQTTNQTTTNTQTTNTTSNETIKYGDADGSGEVDWGDVYFLTAYHKGRVDFKNDDDKKAANVSGIVTNDREKFVEANQGFIVAKIMGTISYYPIEANYGDIDGNGKITMTDCLILFAYLSKNSNMTAQKKATILQGFKGKVNFTEAQNALSELDVNVDISKITDTAELQRLIEEINLNKKQKAMADVNGSGIVNLKDLKLMIDRVNGTIKRLPMEKY